MAVAIKVENLSKAYQLGEIGTGTLSRDLERWFAKIRGKEDPFLKVGETNDRANKGTSDVVWSLKDINCEIQQGDAVGIIGRNGAGKSTLLKLLSRVTSPTTGTIKVKGRIASLLEVGTGFHPELTGKENIYLNGAILGMRKKEIERKFDEIVDFAGVERYIDTPVKRYSSGMYVRLAFAVAAHLESEILIVDEVLAVGDAEFQNKCLGKMNDVSKGEGRTVLFVSHNMGSIMQLCNTGIVLENGKIGLSATINTAVDYYQSANKKAIGYYKRSHLQKFSDLRFEEIFIKNKEGEIDTTFRYAEPITIEIITNEIEDTKGSSIFLSILDSQKARVFSAETEVLLGKMKYLLTIEEKFLSGGRYSLQTFIHVPGIRRFDDLEDVCEFEVIDNESIFIKYGDYKHGVVYGRYSWLL